MNLNVELKLKLKNCFK